MQALLAVLAALVGIVMIPLALAGGTAWLLLPAHLAFAGACTVGAVLAGLGGRPGRSRAFVVGYLAGSVAPVVALSLGSEARDGSWYWILPWAGALLWAWVPPVVGGGAAWLGERRRRSRTRRVVRRRRKALRES